MLFGTNFFIYTFGKFFLGASFLVNFLPTVFFSGGFFFVIKKGTRFFFFSFHFFPAIKKKKKKKNDGQLPDAPIVSSLVGSLG
jgi:hypothetical protein